MTSDELRERLRDIAQQVDWANDQHPDYALIEARDALLQLEWQVLYDSIHPKGEA